MMGQVSHHLRRLITLLIPPGVSTLRLSGEKPKLPHQIKKYDYILLIETIQYLDDVQAFMEKLKPLCHSQTRVIVAGSKYPRHYFWSKSKQPSWLTDDDLNNLFFLESFERVKKGRYLFWFNFAIFRQPSLCRSLSVSIIIPARNEAGNIKNILKKIPQMGAKTEVIFVEGHSQDNTVEAIKTEIKSYHGPLQASFYHQHGNGKGNAVRLGFARAKNELLMILDADLSVAPVELKKFYRAIVQSKGELIIGSRLVYPLEKMAMRFLNLIGNRLFSWVFSYLLGQSIKDTLCGTKVILKKDYQKIAQNRKCFGDFDPFGDFDLIFGAAKLNLKITEIPIRYRERTYGQTNISRFRHGWLLFKMTLIAAKKIKFLK